jgi:hypothetical protein
MSECGAISIATMAGEHNRFYKSSMRIISSTYDELREAFAPAEDKAVAEMLAGVDLDNGQL